MLTNKYFPNFVKAILPFAPVVGVVSTCLLVASAVAQVAEPILNAGISLQVCVKRLEVVRSFVLECGDLPTQTISHTIKFFLLIL
jgi:BASS family bile acid:Na+ symporter